MAVGQETLLERKDRYQVNDPLIPVFVVLLIAGAFGGWINFLLGSPEDVPAPSIWRSIVVGIGASFMVPLFLNMISSNLVDQAKGSDSGKLLIIAGFCLVASISSTAFIRSLSDRVLKEVKEARREAQEAHEIVSNVQESIGPLVAKETESDELTMVPNTRILEDRELSPEGKVLRALSGGRWALRSRTGLATDSGIDLDQIGQVLERMRGEGTVDQSSGKNGPRWFITDKGRDTLAGQ